MATYNPLKYTPTGTLMGLGTASTLQDLYNKKMNGTSSTGTYPGTDIPYGNIVPGKPASGGGYSGFLSTPTTTEPTTPAYPTYPTVDVGSPETMPWEEAYKQAFKRANPQFNILRGRTEQSYSEQRERTPQLLAARYGMAGLRGGRRESAESQVTQKEAQAIQELESEREQAINSMATDIQSNENTGMYQRWYSQAQLKEREADRQWQERKAAYEAAMNRDNKANDLFWKYMEYMRNTGNDAYNREHDKTDLDWEKQKYQSSVEGQDWYNDLYKQKTLAEINRLNKPPASSGGLTANQRNQINSKNATNNALLQVSSYGSKADALAALQQYGSAMINQGVDIQSVMDAINDRWPY